MVSIQKELRFNAILNTFNAGYIEAKDVYNSLTGAEAIRYVLDRNTIDFDGLKKALKKAFRKNVEFSTCYYRYAPEIVHNTIILQ